MDLIEKNEYKKKINDLLSEIEYLKGLIKSYPNFFDQEREFWLKSINKINELSNSLKFLVTQLEITEQLFKKENMMHNAYKTDYFKERTKILNIKKCINKFINDYDAKLNNKCLFCNKRNKIGLHSIKCPLNDLILFKEFEE